MLTETRSERLRKIIEEVEREKPPLRASIDDIRASMGINPKYAIEVHGVRDMVRFLQEHKKDQAGNALTEEAILQYIEHGLKARPLEQFLEPRITTVEFNDCTFNVNAAPAEPTPAPEPEQADDNDPHRFNKADVYDLMEMLTAAPRWELYLADANYDLKEKKRGGVDAKFVALIGVLWRKNIRQNLHDAGAVPVKAAYVFCKRDKTFWQSESEVDSRQTMAAVRLLEDVGFLKKVRKASYGSNGNRGTCAAYQLLNEEKWLKKP